LLLSSSFVVVVVRFVAYVIIRVAMDEFRSRMGRAASRDATTDLYRAMEWSYSSGDTRQPSKQPKQRRRHSNSQAS